MTHLVDTTAVRRRPAGFVLVSGHDRLSYLHTLLSQDLESARPGSVADFLYLDAKGSALAAGRAVVRSGDVVLVTPPEVAADLAAALEKFKFLMDVQAADLGEEWALASIRGPGPVELSGARSEPMTGAPEGGGMIVRDRSGGIDLVGPRDWVAGRVDDLGLPEASESDWQAWRILAGECEWGSEIAAGRRTQELGLLPTHVHLRKGCYPGQESIAKIWNLGRPRRALSIIEFEDPVHAGDEIEVDGKNGVVTSAAPAGTKWAALGLLPVERDGSLRGGGTVACGGATGRVLYRVGEGLPQPGA